MVPSPHFPGNSHLGLAFWTGMQQIMPPVQVWLWHGICAPGSPLLELEVLVLEVLVLEVLEVLLVLEVLVLEVLLELDEVDVLELLLELDPVFVVVLPVGVSPPCPLLELLEVLLLWPLLEPVPNKSSPLPPHANPTPPTAAQTIHQVMRILILPPSIVTRILHRVAPGGALARVFTAVVYDRTGIIRAS